GPTDPCRVPVAAAEGVPVAESGPWEPSLAGEALVAEEHGLDAARSSAVARLWAEWHLASVGPCHCAGSCSSSELSSDSPPNAEATSTPSQGGRTPTQ